jgi:hypothetical protein
MAKPKDDGVLQAVHYDDVGQVLWVRVFLRRGHVWSDYILLDRSELIELIKSGKRIVVGERVPNMGATFETQAPVELVKKNGDEIIVSGHGKVETDCLEGVPII